MRKISLVGIILAAMIVLVGCESKKFAPPPKPSPSQIKILNHHGEEKWVESSQKWDSRIIGQARNDSKQTCTPIIMGNFYNYDNVMVGQSCDWLTDMPAGETWRFEILYLGERIKSYKVWVERIY